MLGHRRARQARLDGSSTTLWSAGGQWFSKGLAVVDDVAYFGRRPRAAGRRSGTGQSASRRLRPARRALLAHAALFPRADQRHLGAARRAHLLVARVQLDERRVSSMARGLGSGRGLMVPGYDVKRSVLGC